ncbi:hypothetical protein Q7P37_000343 [Cladosporium fusiforme]
MAKTALASERSRMVWHGGGDETTTTICHFAAYLAWPSVTTSHLPRAASDAFSTPPGPLSIAMKRHLMHPSLQECGEACPQQWPPDI